MESHPLRHPLRQPATGFTLFEVMAAVAIVGIVAAIAVSGLSGSIASVRANGEAKALGDDLAAARALAASSGVPTGVCVSETGTILRFRKGANPMLPTIVDETVAAVNTSAPFPDGVVSRIISTNAKFTQPSTGTTTVVFDRNGGATVWTSTACSASMTAFPAISPSVLVAFSFQAKSDSTRTSTVELWTDFTARLQ